MDPYVLTEPDLCEFQAKLTSEKVVLDITSAKFVRLNRDSRSSDTYYTVRLQIWHEAELRRSTTSDVASFVTAGTALSGPLRERLVASSSRLIIYLGRLGEYITLFGRSPLTPFLAGVVLTTGGKSDG